MPTWRILSFLQFPLDVSTVQPSVNVKMGNWSLWSSKRVVRVVCFCLSAVYEVGCIRALRAEAQHG